MKLPQLYTMQGHTDVISRFAGVNFCDKTEENEFSYCENLSSRAYPLIAPRTPRQMVKQLTAPQGMIGHDKLLFIDDGYIWYGGVKIDHIPLSPKKKQLVQIGSSVAIFPDKLLFDTKTLTLEAMEYSFMAQGNVHVTLCSDPSGQALANTPVISSVAPQEPTENMHWIDTSASPHVLKVWHSASGTWVSQLQTYLKITCPNIGKGFRQYDGVTIEGLGAHDGQHVIYGTSDNTLIIMGICDQSFSANSIYIKRSVPDMDFVTQCDNRLWGCSSANHAIYACKLGDAKNWNCFMGLASDSYAMTVGTPGAFTGCCTHMGSVVFFKADAHLRIYGTKPSNFQLSTLHAAGISKGNAYSAAVVNETLFYLTREGVLCCDGGLPAPLGRALSPLRLENGLGQGYMGKYYLSCDDQNGDPQLLVYDDTLALWHRQDDTRAVAMCVCDNLLYLIDQDDRLLCIGGDCPYRFEETQKEAFVPWVMQSAWIGLDDPMHKHVRRLMVQAQLFSGSQLQVSVRYDDDPLWQAVSIHAAPVFSALQIPIRPRRAQRMQLRITGYGDARIYSICKVTESGSELGGSL
ncbi:MAG: hypothetical protein J6L88_08720 [Clostridia bacterium]|nr:hypothetical protein [Clostridia bacterium]